MALFDKSILVLLQHEGGLVDHPADAAGITNFGISLRFLKEYPHVGDFDNDGDVDAEDIKNMTIDDAKKIYKELWWDKYKYGNIVDQTIATKVFDASVNMGSKRAHKLLQAALNKAFGLKLTVDGILGPASIGVVNACTDDTEQLLLTAYCNQMWSFYQNIIAHNPKLKVFEKGWKNRAFSLSKANMM